MKLHVYTMKLSKVLLFALSLNVSTVFADECPEALIDVNSNMVSRDAWVSSQSPETLNATYAACKLKSDALFEAWKTTKEFSKEQHDLSSKNEDVIAFLRVLGEATRNINDIFCNIHVSNIIRYSSKISSSVLRYKILINFVESGTLNSEEVDSGQRLKDIIQTYKDNGTDCLRSFL